MNAAQAFVKIVPGGGANGPKGIKRQLDYLSRNGDVPIHRSDRYQRIELPYDSLKGHVEAWAEQTGNYNKTDKTKKDGSDLTTHIVVSFPKETAEDAAYEAALDWAGEMFNSGKYDGKYDYVTVFHTDKDHPHLHVVVNRRELEQNHWLKISKRNEYINYESMRDVMVEVAARHDIYLEASSRAERGIEGNPITLSDYYRLARQDVIFEVDNNSEKRIQGLQISNDGSSGGNAADGGAPSIPDSGIEVDNDISPALNENASSRKRRRQENDENTAWLNDLAKRARLEDARPLDSNNAQQRAVEDEAAALYDPPYGKRKRQEADEFGARLDHDSAKRARLEEGAHDDESDGREGIQDKNIPALDRSESSRSRKRGREDSDGFAQDRRDDDERNNTR